MTIEYIPITHVSNDVIESYVSVWRKVFEENEHGQIDRIIWYDQESVIVTGKGRRVRALRHADGLEVWQLAAAATTNTNQQSLSNYCQVIKNRFDPGKRLVIHISLDIFYLTHSFSGTIHILSDDLLWSVSSYGEMLWSTELPTKYSFLFCQSYRTIFFSFSSKINIKKSLSSCYFSTCHRWKYRFKSKSTSNNVLCKTRW